MFRLWIWLNYQHEYFLTSYISNIIYVCRYVSLFNPSGLVSYRTPVKNAASLSLSQTSGSARVCHIWLFKVSFLFILARWAKLSRKLTLKSPIFVPFRANLTRFECKIGHPCSPRPFVFILNTFYRRVIRS